MVSWFWFICMYIFLDDLLSQTGVCLKNDRRWKIAQKQISVLVLQYEEISPRSEYRDHWEALIVAEASMSQWPLSIRDFRVPLHVVYVDYDVLLCECNVVFSIRHCLCGSTTTAFVAHPSWSFDEPQQSDRISPKVPLQGCRGNDHFSSWLL